MVYDVMPSDRLCGECFGVWHSLELFLHPDVCACGRLCDPVHHLFSQVSRSRGCPYHTILPRTAQFWYFRVTRVYSILCWFRYIREAKNFSWIDLNAPGMFSSFGFLALFIAAAYIGKLCNEDKVSYRLIRLIALTIAMGVCFFVSHHYVDEASRRLV